MLRFWGFKVSALLLCRLSPNATRGLSLSFWQEGKDTLLIMSGGTLRSRAPNITQYPAASTTQSPASFAFTNAQWGPAVAVSVSLTGRARSLPSSCVSSELCDVQGTLQTCPSLNDALSGCMMAVGENLNNKKAFWGFTRRSPILLPLGTQVGVEC